MGNRLSDRTVRPADLLIGVVAGGLLLAVTVSGAAAQTNPGLAPHTSTVVQIAATAVAQATPTPPPRTNIRNQTSAVQVVPTSTPPPQTNINNQVAVVLPPATPPPDTLVHIQSTPVGVRDVGLTTPDYLQPGDHELDFTPTVQSEADLWVAHSRFGDPVSAILDPNAPGLFLGCQAGAAPDVAYGWSMVGWAQQVGDDGHGIDLGCASEVAQTAVRFDISQLFQGGPKFVTSVHLSFSEREWKWTDGQSNERTVAGCVAAIGVANTDFAAQPPPSGQLYSYDIYDDVTPSAAHDFDVTIPVQDWFSPASPRYGFVLKGSIEDLHNDDASSCMSQIWSIFLHVSYTVV